MALYLWIGLLDAGSHEEATALRKSFYSFGARLSKRFRDSLPLQS